uniref:response regulator transcription factor n=1 Tax=Lachnospira sp. TaxID=2049031 RepID=UPI003FEEF9C5
MPNILIVEDDININNLLCEVLRKAGYTCEQAFSGTEAKLLLNIKEKAYTLVLLDLMLPGASGEEVLKEIRKHGRLSVIVLTAKDSIDDKIGVLTDGADDYITKPFEIREVLARIQVQLRHIEAETESEAKGETESETKGETKSETKVKTKAGMQEGQYSGRLEFRDMVLTRSTFEVSIGGRVLPKIT